MKKLKYKICAISILIFTTTFLNAQSIETMLYVPFDTIGGITTDHTPLDMYGISCFTMIDDHTIAIVCDTEGKTKIFDTNTKEMTHEFEAVGKSITYDKNNELIYISSYDKVNTYGIDGSLKNVIPFKHESLLGLVVNGNDVIAKCFKGENFFIIKDGKVLETEEQLKTKFTARFGNDINTTWSNVNHQLTKYEISKDGVKKQYEIPLSRNESSRFIPIGFIDDYFILNEMINSSDFERNAIVFYSTTLEKSYCSFDTPLLYYMTDLYPFCIFEKKIYHLLPTPNGAYLFKIDPNSPSLKSTTKTQHPQNLIFEYHFKKKQTN